MSLNDLKAAATATGFVFGAMALSGCAALNKDPTYRSILSQTVLGAPQSGPEHGPEVAYLTDEASVAPKDTLSGDAPLLPLQTGNHWNMQNLVGNKRGEENLVVTGPVTNGFGQSGMGVETQRNGKRFRYEIYRSDATGLYLLAAQDETSTLMSYNPPVPLARYPAKEGDTFLWTGQMRLGKETLSATGLSRFTTQENVKTQAGPFHAFRLDDMISVNRGGQEVRFPAVRWFSPRIGFIRRGYAEKNTPAFAELSKFDIH